MLKLPDNVMNRPFTPGGLSDGTELVTRQFGNRNEQASSLPSTPNGWGGVANSAAGMEDIAAGRAAEQVAASVQDTVSYMKNLQAADEDSRQKAMFLKLEGDSKLLREKLLADPSHTSKSVDEQNTVYSTERDLLIDKAVAETGFSSPQIVKIVKDNTAQFKARDTDDYRYKYAIPMAVDASKRRDAAMVSDVIGVAQETLSPEMAAKAAMLIDAQTTSPQANAMYTAPGAAALRATHREALVQGLATAGMKRADDQFADIVTKVGLTGIVDKTAVNEGPVRAAIDDYVNKVDNVMLAGGANESQRFIVRENVQKAATQRALASIAHSNEAFKRAEVEALDGMNSEIMGRGDALQIAASNREATPLVINSFMTDTLRSLGIDPIAANENKLTDPMQIKLYHRVVNQAQKAASEQRRAVSAADQERSTRAMEKLVTQMVEKEGGIVGQAQVNKEYAEVALKEGGIGMTKGTIDFVRKTGVPSQLVQVISGQLQSGDPKQEAAAAQSLLMLDAMGPKVQTSLYKALPPQLEAVLPLLRAGKDWKAATEELNRAKPSPEAEKDLAQNWLSDNDKGRKTKSFLKDAASASDLDLDKMSPPARDIFERDAKASWMQYGGNADLAVGAMKRKTAQNSRVRVNPMTGMYEVNPITHDSSTGQDVPVAGINAVADKQLPSTVGKNRTFMANGPTLFEDGTLRDTWTVITVDPDTRMTVVHDSAFYVTPSAIEKIEVEREQKAVADYQQAKGIVSPESLGLDTSAPPLTRAERKAAEEAKTSTKNADIRQNQLKQDAFLNAERERALAESKVQAKAAKNQGAK